MKKIFEFRFFLLMTVVLGFSSCYEDKGNYDYEELKALVIDTTGNEVKAEMTAVQFENFKVPVKVSYAGDKSDLAFEWKIYPQNPQKPDEVAKFDSAVVLSRQEVFDTVIYEVPGKYYLTYTVTNRANDTKEYLTIKLNVESALSRGLCVLDEKDGFYDLHMIKTAKLLTDIKEEDEKIYDHVFTKVNDRTETAGKFLGQYNTNLYFFTETGAYVLNSNTFGIVSDDYRGLFSFALSINPKPQAFMLTSRPMEMIVNDGLVYKFDHMSWGTETFGDRLNGDYYAASFLPRISTSTFSTVIYDMKNGRFAPIDQFGSNVGEFEDNNEAEFNLNNIGKDQEIRYMENGFNDYTYAIFKNKTTSAYALYVADFSGREPMPVIKYDMSGCTGLDDNCLYAFGNRGNICFYASGSDLCQYKYASANTGAVVHTFVGETITNLKVFKKNGHAEDGKLLMVSTCTAAGEGKVYLIGFNELNGNLGAIGRPYEGFGRIADVYFKE